MKPSHMLKLKALESKPRFKFIGNQEGIEPFEVYPFYNLICPAHELHGSTLAFETIKNKGLTEAL